MYLLDRVSMGVRIRERREELNITKCRLADMLGNTPKFIGVADFMSCHQTALMSCL